VGQMYHALFGSPLPEEGAESTVPARIDKARLAGSPNSTVLLPWLGTAGLRVGRRLRLGLAALGLVGVVAVLLLVAGRVNMGNARTAAGSPTILVTATSTPTATSTLTATPTAIATPTPAVPAAAPAVARLELSKGDDPDPVASGASLTYTLAYTNAGDATATGVVIADTLDPNVTYVGASITSTRRTTSTLYWDVGALSPGIAGEIVISVTVPCGLGEGAVLTNTATLGSDEIAPLAVSQTTVISGVDAACIVPPTATPTPTPTNTPRPAQRRPTSTNTPEPTDIPTPTDTPPPTSTPTRWIPSPPPPTSTPASDSADD